MADAPKKTDPAQKRKSPRVDFFQKVRVVVPEDHTAVDMFAANVSGGGMFLRSNQPLPKGKKVELEFDVPTGRVRIPECEVVWSRPFEPISLGGEPAGMGVQFKAMSAEAQQTIEDFIQDALDASPAARPAAPKQPDLAESGAVASGPKPEPAFAGAVKELPPAPVPLVPPMGPEDSEPPVPARTPPRPSPPRSAPGAKGDAPHVLDFAVLDLSELPTDPPAQIRPPLKPHSARMHLPLAEAPRQPMVELSQPPTPKTRFLLFAIFVVVVATATFLTLFWLGPLGNGEEVGAEAPGTQGTRGTARTTEPEQPAIAAPTPPEPEPAKPEPLKPEPAKPESPKPEPPKPAVVATGPAQVDLPTFEKTSTGWRMEISASGPVEWKTFTLKDPARLAIDAKGASYAGQRQALDNPAPFVSRVRIGKQPDQVRYVLDFGAQIPRYDLQKSPQKLVVTFP